MNRILKIALVLTLNLIFLKVMAQLPSKVTKVDATPNQITTVASSLEKGEIINDLTWASKSNVACFPATQNTKFRGNHVLHQFEIPPYSEVTVTLIPKNKSDNMSIYGYQVHANKYPIPPNLSSCVSCEAEYKWDYAKRGKTQDHTRSIFFNSIHDTYNIFIGVAGADGLASGDYEIKIDLKTKVENTNEQEDFVVYNVKTAKGKIATTSGDLNEGVVIQDLSFAAKSNVACFPATQNHKFTGNHVFFVTEIPRYSKMHIKLIPEDKKANMSLYAYQDGVSKEVYPPELSSCVSCEADYKWDYAKRGKTQDHTRHVYFNAINNPYRIVFVVAGADGLKNGAFKVEIIIE